MWSAKLKALGGNDEDECRSVSVQSVTEESLFYISWQRLCFDNWQENNSVIFTLNFKLRHLTSIMKTSISSWLITNIIGEQRNAYTPAKIRQFEVIYKINYMRGWVSDSKEQTSERMKIEQTNIYHPAMSLESLSVWLALLRQPLLQTIERYWLARSGLLEMWAAEPNWLTGHQKDALWEEAWFSETVNWTGNLYLITCKKAAPSIRIQPTCCVAEVKDVITFITCEMFRGLHIFWFEMWQHFATIPFLCPSCFSTDVDSWFPMTSDHIC